MSIFYDTIMYVYGVQGVDMQRTQIYLEDNLIVELKTVAKSMNISMSEFIRGAVKKELKKHGQNSLLEFIDSLQPLESFENIDATEYVDNIRNKSRIVK